MKAAPAQQRRLLDLADLDAELARARHQLTQLPEAARVAEVTEQLAVAEEDVVRAEAAVAEMQRTYDATDEELTGITEHAKRDQTQLDSGLLSHKALAELQHELSGLELRRDVLESDLLEIMERQEALGMESERAQGTVLHHRELLAEAVTARDHATATTENTVTEFLSRRAAIADEVADDLLAVYDRLREQGRVGAGLLRQRRCGACRMELDPRTLSAVAAAAEDEVVRCEECTAIMVRTEQSGLPTPGSGQ
ncbi:C4-type zinc ribbon domain-containing protein [Gordonia alkaliphila]|uniref:zinc ribbon domain-containing protein n=1 Tax=Gordonia alkaliphila TaxID=1053547 RepID=UPI001FF42DFB|nr:C4-type zinc ribbon domain-containing protein [Gordonia alkaliphila]MCK0441032.1 C4-type zinc ribbon domain-containing protein [Gordonia alkaliphila]